MSDPEVTGSGRPPGEAAIIAALVPLTARFPGAFALGDDCALLAPEPGMDLVLKTDAVASGVHFFDGERAADVGWKALAVNVSDLVAKGADPRVYLMSLSFPDAPAADWLAGFVDGLAEAQRAFGIVLAGGDTDRRPGPLSITIMAVGAVPAGRMVRRGSAAAGDILYVSGTVGDSFLGLSVRSDPDAAARLGLGVDDASLVRGRYARPTPRLALAPVVLRHARAAMDLSDGLVKDLGRMARASGVGAVVDAARVPLSRAGQTAVDRDATVLAALLTGGDDYEVLAAVPPQAAAAFEADSAAAGVAVTAVGAITDDDAVVVRDRTGQAMTFPREGWDHF